MDQELHLGHRARLLQRLVDHEDSLQDHELLEIILYNAIPRKNTNEIAHALLKQFGSLSGVLRANHAALCSVSGVGPSTAAYLQSIELVIERAAATFQPFYFTPQNFAEISEYLKKRLRALRYECIELYAADCSGKIFGVERYSSHLEDTSSVTPMQVTKFFYKFAPKGLLVAHNHPGPSSKPSRDDDVFTRWLLEICNLNSIKLLDHIIIGTDSVFSYHIGQRMEYIKTISYRP